MAGTEVDKIQKWVYDWMKNIKYTYTNEQDMLAMHRKMQNEYRHKMAEQGIKWWKPFKI